MNGKRGEDDDDTIDREIAAALNVDPSPDFIPRTRARITLEASRNRWNYWVLAATGAVVLTTVALFAVATAHPRPSVLKAVTKPPASVAQTTIELPTKPQEAPAWQPDKRRRARNVSGLEEKRRQPEVVISPGEAQALLTLVDMLRAGKTDLPQPQSGTEAINQTLAPFDDISISVITIESLSQSQ
jgi:hypothetical protein